MLPCGEDASVMRSAATLVRANFSYDDADALTKEAPASVPAERRECDDCGFKSTSDDASKEQDYCTACGGNSPAGGPDECAHCGAKNHMVMACPKCGGRFSLDGEAPAATGAGEDWITWSGGANPMPNEYAEVRRRDGREVVSATNRLDWLHSPRRSDPADIVGYRPLRAQPQAREEAQPDSGEAGREAIWKVVHEVWQLLDGGETDSAGVTTIVQERLQAVSEAMDALEALVPEIEGPFWGGFPVNYFWSRRAGQSGGPQEEVDAERIHEVMAEGDGFWKPCSGCQESVDGCVSTKDYPYSATFKCQPGGGCSECGGLGVNWDDTDYEEMAQSMIADGALNDAAALAPVAAEGGETFQGRVLPWLIECFGAEIAGNLEERCDRFIEEALEQVQSLGWAKERALALVDYVYGRPAGEPHQEAGGVMVTFAALCQAAGLNMTKAGEDELARIMRPEIVLKIRAKQAAKPTGSALPVAALRTEPTGGGEGA